MPDWISSPGPSPFPAVQPCGTGRLGHDDQWRMHFSWSVCCLWCHGNAAWLFM